ncbi:hypothetical protein [Nocardia arizonensis]|uniref:hypothetical protein n=1 Tax=Nocardia arizonensis TaxID=1141647 RepID=UPI0012E15EEE|nr:hypothetical protein [Nocardia arizonensis]
MTLSTGAKRSDIVALSDRAETSLCPLRPLERDLWLTPLADGVRTALGLTGAAAHILLESPVATAVFGVAVTDLKVLGISLPRPNPLRLLDPRPGVRQVRVGTLSAALPELARRLCERVDTDLAELPQLPELSDAALVTVLDKARTTLAALHGYQALTGMFSGNGESAPTAAAMALDALGHAHLRGLPPERVVAELPVVLALAAPRISAALVPPTVEPSTAEDVEYGSALGELALARDTLRPRVRRVQELGGCAAWEIGSRMSAAGLLDEPDDVALLRFGELRRILDLSGAAAGPAGEILPRGVITVPGAGCPPSPVMIETDQGPVA